MSLPETHTLRIAPAHVGQDVLMLYAMQVKPPHTAAPMGGVLRNSAQADAPAHQSCNVQSIAD